MPTTKQKSILPNAIANDDVISRDVTFGNAIENSPEFRQAMTGAWRKVMAGMTPQEAEFSVAPGRNGIVMRPTVVTDDRQDLGIGQVKAHVYPNDKLIFHTHPNNLEGRPSSTDIASAKSSHIPILTGSRDGLFEIDPYSGGVEQLASGLDWTNLKEPFTPSKPILGRIKR